MCIKYLRFCKLEISNTIVQQCKSLPNCLGIYTLNHISSEHSLSSAFAVCPGALGEKDEANF